MIVGLVIYKLNINYFRKYILMKHKFHNIIHAACTGPYQVLIRLSAVEQPKNT